MFNSSVKETKKSHGRAFIIWWWCYLSDGGAALGQRHYKNTVGLADAALRPRRQLVITQVQCHLERYKRPVNPLHLGLLTDDITSDMASPVTTA